MQFNKTTTNQAVNKNKTTMSHSLKGLTIDTRTNISFLINDVPKKISTKTLAITDEDPSSEPSEPGLNILSEDSLNMETKETNFQEILKKRLAIETKFQELRKKDFSRLDVVDNDDPRPSTVYLDYTGSSLAPKRLVDEHSKILTSRVLGNPHSNNEPSQFATKQDIEARQKVLDFVKADPQEYIVIWTPNASGALKLVGECYPFSRNKAYLHGPDCHNSVLGISQYAKNKGAETGGFGFYENSMCYDWENYKHRLRQLRKDRKAPGLVAFPGESNLSGLKHNVSKYVQYAHNKGWDVCVDLAAYAPTTPTDVNAMGKPEFLALSFYKIFGYPTGIGALVVKRTAATRLEKPWFAGGTVSFVGASNKNTAAFLLQGDDPAKFEDGTVNFQNFAAVSLGVDYMMNTVGMEDLDQHVSSLARTLLDQLRELTWDNGAPLVHIPAIPKECDERLGHAISMLFLAPDGSILVPKLVEKLLMEKNIAIRVGCFCNPHSAFKMVEGRVDIPGKTYDNFIDWISSFSSTKTTTKPFHWGVDILARCYEDVGLIRASLGMATNMKDIDTFLSCLRKEILSNQEEICRQNVEEMQQLECRFSVAHKFLASGKRNLSLRKRCH